MFKNLVNGTPSINLSQKELISLGLDSFCERIESNSVEEQIMMAKFLVDYRQKQSMINCRTSELQRQEYERSLINSSYVPLEDMGQE